MSMSRKVYLGLFLLGLLIALLASGWVKAPGYMDADYYYAGGLRLAQGYGLNEMILWNYLDMPVSLPHPSHTYWMPLPSILSALGMLLGGISFPAARLPFLLLAGFLPPVTAWLAYTLTGRYQTSLLAGLLAAFPGFYLPYLVTTESFGLYMLLGSFIIILAFSRLRSQSLRFLLLGVLAGLMHLSRADGLIWLLGVLFLAAWQAYAARRSQPRWMIASFTWLSAVVVGYGLVTSFWYARNLQVYNSLLPPGGSTTLWLLDYNQTFNFPPTGLTFSNWIAAGPAALLRVRWDAFVANIKTLVGVQGQVFLLPLVMAGLWRLRRDSRVRFGGIMWLATLLFMSLIFPLAGARGGFFHSGAALQPLLWAAAAAGFEVFIEVGVRLRHWKPQRAAAGFTVILILISAVMTTGLYLQRVVGSDPNQLAWDQSYRDYQAADAFLKARGASPYQYVMVNNPPGFYAATGRPALVIPNGDEAVLLSAASRYSVDYIVLETNHVQALESLYQASCNRNGLIFLGSQGSMRFFKTGNKP